jgi:hypothetical protein
MTNDAKHLLSTYFLPTDPLDILYLLQPVFKIGSFVLLFSKYCWGVGEVKVIESRSRKQLHCTVERSGGMSANPW